MKKTVSKVSLAIGVVSGSIITSSTSIAENNIHNNPKVQDNFNESTINAIKLLEAQEHLELNINTGEVIIKKTLLEKLNEAGVLQIEPVGLSTICTRTDTVQPK